MYEHRPQPVIPRWAFARRVARHAVPGLVLVAFSLGIGVLGYRWLAGLSGVDAPLNASMILGGMRPVEQLRTDSVKMFASCYALFVMLGSAASRGPLTPVKKP